MQHSQPDRLLVLTDIPCRLDLAELDESVSGLVEGGGDDGGSLSLSLGADDGGLALLLGLLDDELGTLGVLLRDLLLLDGRRELLSEPVWLACTGVSVAYVMWVCCQL